MKKGKLIMFTDEELKQLEKLALDDPQQVDPANWPPLS